MKERKATAAVNPKFTNFSGNLGMQVVNGYQSTQSHRFRRTVTGPVLTTSTTVVSSGSLQFQLSSVDNSTEFTTLFDSYRIDAIRVNFYPQTVANTGTSNSGLFYTAADFDDGSASTIAQLRQYDNVITNRVTGDPWTVILVPKAVLAAFDGSNNPGAQSIPGQWFDCGYPSIYYYGLKYAIDISSAVYTVSTTIDYYLSFKETR